MAWSAVVSAVTTFGKLLAEEADYLRSVEEKVDRLLADLTWMQNFLTNEDGSNPLQAAEIRDLADDAEDVVETFVLEIGSKRKPGFTNCIKRSACILQELWMLHQTRSEIDKIIAKRNDLVRRLNAYRPKVSGGRGEGQSSSSEKQEKRRPYPQIKDKNTVGLDDVEKLVAILVDEGSECSRVVCICGTGGLGKTTLAKKIKKHKEVTGLFEHLAFLYVSQVCKKREVWEEILSKLTSIEERGRVMTN
ncbi:CC-NBS-LRR class disease resistance protein [Hibiscus syriacus]|uniref:CC-NBS-LRR class disease resistance protein n=1 Tax=Hibiscus syriacus TaxID=106335 RepID=A0A6A2ZW71_HIBSY|nr:CC-NBS-LRR class disease resistance protein [Hibiscus syriacus]